MVGKRQRSVKKSPAQVKRDLEIFEKGIVRLKELEGDLKALDTRGFYAEEKNIRSRLKNVSDIPLIEREIKSLRFKINNKHKRRVVKKSPYKKIGKDLEEVKGELPGIKRSIKLLNESLDKVPKKRTSKIDLGVGSLVENDFDVFLGDIKSTLSERIRGREREIKNILDADLRKRDDKFNKKHRALVGAFRKNEKKLREVFEKKYKERVATSLKREVESKFNRELNEKLKSEKNSLAKKYQSHLNAHVAERLKRDRERLQKKLLKELDKKVVSLHKDFERKSMIVEGDLRKRYGEKLNSVEGRKRELDVKAKRFAMERKSQMERISRLNEIKKKKIKEQQEHARKLDEERVMVEEREKKREKEFGIIKLALNKRAREKEQRKMKELVKQKALLDSQRKECGLFLEEEKRKLKERIKKNNLELAGEKLKLSMELEKHSRELDDEKLKLEEAKNVFQLKKKEEREAVKKSLTEQISGEMEKKLVDKEMAVRSQIKSEYNLMLKKKLQERDEELKKRKFALEMDIQRRMRAALK